MVFLDKTTLEGVFNRAARKECIIEPLRRSVLRKSGSIKRKTASSVWVALFLFSCLCLYVQKSF